METPTLYAAPAPYPAVRPGGPDLACARMLSGALASNTGELTAITQYTYFSWILEPDAEPLRQCFRQIARVEMYHLNLLGQMIVALGGDPIFRAYAYRRPAFWSSGCLHYQSDTEKALRISIAGEQTAIEGYQRLSKLIQDSNVNAVLQRIIQDETIHVQLFQQYLTTG